MRVKECLDSLPAFVLKPHPVTMNREKKNEKKKKRPPVFCEKRAQNSSDGSVRRLTVRAFFPSGDSRSDLIRLVFEAAEEVKRLCGERLFGRRDDLE